MADIIKWSVVLLCPGEDELALMAELSARRDARIVAVADATGASVGGGLAEVMGLRVITKLADLESGSAQYLVHPPFNDEIQAVVDTAPRFGLEPMLATDFERLAGTPPLLTVGSSLQSGAGSPVVPVSPRPAVGGDLEKETAAIHHTLSRIEEALDREALLRWLLSLATRATGATSGSIMLFDEATQELYIAFAYGLSQHTMHSTRVKPGEGIAGRVAVTRRAELVGDNRHPGSERDRPDIQQAISAPIIWEDSLLGVLNVSTADGDGVLALTALATIESLTHRFGLILHRFLSMQLVQDDRVYQAVDAELLRDTGHPQALAATLRDWARDLCDAACAESATFHILTADGDLFWASADNTGFQVPPSVEQVTVLTSGEAHVSHASAEGETVFILPVGRDPQRALLTLRFANPRSAHQFHSKSAEIIYLVQRHLCAYLERVVTADQLDRLTTLAAALSGLAAKRNPVDYREGVLAAACHLTGAADALLVMGAAHEQPDPGVDVTLHREAVRLLEDAGQAGWQTTVLEAKGQPAGRSLLVVPFSAENPFPGLVLFDKQRLYPLDGQLFSEFDALFARRLLPLVEAHMQGMHAAVPTITAAETDQIIDQISPVSAAGDLVRDGFAAVLQREMARCDRYHTMLGLIGFRMPPGHTVDLAVLVAEIDRRLRTSDQTGCLEDGTILIIVPEDIQSLRRLQKRVVEIIRAVAGIADLAVKTASRVHPGASETADGLLAALVAALVD